MTNVDHLKEEILLHFYEIKIVIMRLKFVLICSFCVILIKQFIPWTYIATIIPEMYVSHRLIEINNFGSDLVLAHNIHVSISRQHI